MMKCAGLRMEPYRTPLVTGGQLDVTPFTVTPCAQPLSQGHEVFIQLNAGHFVWKALLRSKHVTYIQDV